MGIITNEKYKDAVNVAKSVFGVQERLNKAKEKEFKEKYKADIAKAKKSRNSDNDYVKRRDSGLIDRKIWHNGDQISLYDITYCTGKYKYAVYYEQDKANNPSEEQFEHMLDLSFKDLETATTVFKVLFAACPIILSMNSVRK